MINKFWHFFEDKILALLSALGFLAIMSFQWSANMNLTGTFYSAVISLFIIAAMNVVTCAPYINKSKAAIIVVVTGYTILMIYELATCVYTTVGIWNKIVTGAVCMVVGIVYISFELMILCGFYYPEFFEHISEDKDAVFDGFTYIWAIGPCALRLFSVCGYLWFVQPVQLMYILYLIVTELGKVLFLVSVIARFNRIIQVNNWGTGTKM